MVQFPSPRRAAEFCTFLNIKPWATKELKKALNNKKNLVFLTGDALSKNVREQTYEGWQKENIKTRLSYMVVLLTFVMYGRVSSLWFLSIIKGTVASPIFEYFLCAFLGKYYFYCEEIISVAKLFKQININKCRIQQKSVGMFLISVLFSWAECSNIFFDSFVIQVTF